MQNLQTPLIIWVTIVLAAVILWSNIARISPNSSQDKTVSVQGEGKSMLVPDIYNFSITASEVGKTTKGVNEAITKKVNEAMKILADNKIDKKDIQSQNINISENRVYDNSSSRPEWYRGMHTLNIKVRNIANAGKIMDELTAIDGLLVNSWDYAHDNKDATLDAARKLAFENAKAKAENLANLAGMKLGKPVSINESSQNSYYPPMYQAREMAMDSGAWGETTINPGEQELSVQVNIVFEIK